MKDFQQLVNKGFITQLNFDTSKIPADTAKNAIDYLVSNKLLTQPAAKDFITEWWDKPDSDLKDPVPDKKPAPAGPSTSDSGSDAGDSDLNPTDPVDVKAPETKVAPATHKATKSTAKKA